jgi:hypothetical protein
MRRLVVATGGGGDALGAAMISLALPADVDVAIFTYAWERLRVDPLPGPRGAADFRGLRPVGELNGSLLPSTRVNAPSDSTLPRLAGEIATPLLLLDPARGAAGLRDQISEIVELERVDKVWLVDIGGDAAARGDEPEATSPLADAMVIAACAELAVPTELVVGGPGLDGELAAAAVLKRLRDLGGRQLASLTPRHADGLRASLEWHPTEATALLAAAAQGHRGTVELRGEGATVELTDESADVYAIDLRQVYEASSLAPLLSRTRSLAESEDVVRAVCGTSEIDYERRKLEDLARQDKQPIRTDVRARAIAYIDEAGRRGIDLLTCRRIAEAIGSPRIGASELRRQLLTVQPDQNAFPLWSTRPRVGTSTAIG